MTEPTEFQKAYFLQTRQETDTDKKIRDTTLNFAVVVIGAIGFVVFKADNAQAFVASKLGALVSVSAWIIITGLSTLAGRRWSRSLIDGSFCKGFYKIIPTGLTPGTLWKRL